MQRVLIGCGTALANHLSALSSFDLHLSYRQALAGVPVCAEAVVVAPAARRLSGGNLGWGGRHLIAALKGRARRLSVLSSLDVYPVKSLPFDEDGGICEIDPRASWMREGAPLFAFEQGVRSAAPAVVVLRLPDVFGPGFARGASRHLADGVASRLNRVAICQWYPAHRLEHDLIVARHLRAPVVNLCSEPVSMAKVLKHAFPGETGYVQTPAHYSRIGTRFAEAFGGTGGYIMSADEVLAAICQYVSINRKLALHARIPIGSKQKQPAVLAAPAHPG